jgi:hypothetical protein
VQRNSAEDSLSQETSKMNQTGNTALTPTMRRAGSFRHTRRVAAGRPDHLTSHAVVDRPSTRSVDVHAERLLISQATPTDAVAIEVAAGRAAFETYGASGVHINPHDYQSAGRKNWTSGFDRAAGQQRSS